MHFSMRYGVATVAVLGAALIGAGAVRQASDRPQQAPAAEQHAAVPDIISPEPAPPPGVERVPETETAETQPPSAQVRQSFGRAAGLHRTKDPLRLASSAAVAIDQDTGRVLVQKNEDAILPIASLTKMMTALIVAEGKQPLDQEITITEEDVDTERHSRSRLRVGTTLTRGEALHLALMSSENRAAHALGRSFPGGLPQFVNAMNNKAQSLGMKGSTFVDPTGLSTRNQSTARDLATLAMEASRHPLLREYSTTPRHQVNFGKRRLQYLNSNRLVKDPQWDIVLQKTGYIVEAGQCVAMSTRMNGHNIVMVLLDATDKGSRSADAERIRNWVVSQGGSSAGTLAMGKGGAKS